MRILVSGSRGFIGSALVELLSGEGHEVLRLVRKSSFKENGDFVWDPVHDYVDTKAFAGCDAVVHLAAENISGRWTEEKMRKIRDSRVRGAKIICDGIKSLEQKPAVYVRAIRPGSALRVVHIPGLCPKIGPRTAPTRCWCRNRNMLRCAR